MNLLKWIAGLFLRKRLAREGAKVMAEAAKVAGGALVNKKPTMGEFYKAVETGDWSKMSVKPKPGCKHCYGRGYSGRDSKTARPVVCSCLTRALRRDAEERRLLEFQQRIAAMSICEKQCKGACCRSGRVVVMPSELAEMEKKAGVKAETCMTPVKHWGPEGHDPQWEKHLPVKLDGADWVACLKVKPDGYCIFHSAEEGCRLARYGVKPMVCRVYPYWYNEKSGGVVYDRLGAGKDLNGKEIGEVCPAIKLPVGQTLPDLKLDGNMVRVYVKMLLDEARRTKAKRKALLKKLMATQVQETAPL